MMGHCAGSCCGPNNYPRRKRKNSRGFVMKSAAILCVSSRNSYVIIHACMPGATRGGGRVGGFPPPPPNHLKIVFIEFHNYKSTSNMVSNAFHLNKPLQKLFSMNFKFTEPLQKWFSMNFENTKPLGKLF